MAEVPARGNILGKCVPARFKLAVLGSIGMGVIYGLKVNLSVALVGMLNHTAITMEAQSVMTKTQNLDDQLRATADNNTDPLLGDGPYLWSEPLQGTILSCYFWGYIISQIPGGRLAETFSAKWVMFLSVVINIIGTLLTPVMADLHYSAIIIIRVCEGIGGGMALPALYCLVGRWALPDERGRMTFMFYMGTALGSAKAYLTGTNMLRLFGWEYVFYVMGGLSFTWCMLWIILVQDFPQQQPYIDQKEREMIMKALGNTSYKRNEKLKMPWKSVFQSPAFLAILIAHTCSNWGWYMLLLELPFYFKQVLKFNITENALLAAAPFITLWMFSLIFGRILNYFKMKNKITVTTSRKIGTSVASLVPALCLLGLCYIGFYQSSAIGLTAVGITSMAGMFCGFLSNHIDIAPNFAGTLMALTNTMATVPGIVVPVFVGYVTEKNQTIYAWRIIFFVTIGFYIAEFLVYNLFGSGEEQSWNRLGSNKTEDQPLRQKVHQLKA